MKGKIIEHNFRRGSTREMEVKSTNEGSLLENKEDISSFGADEKGIRIDEHAFGRKR